MCYHLVELLIILNLASCLDQFAPNEERQRYSFKKSSEPAREIRAAPGGPFDAEKAVSPQVKAAREAQYNLNQPMHQQFFSYLTGLVQGDMGPSFKYPGRSVDELIFQGLPVTAELGLYALLFAVVLGVLAGVFASLKPNTRQDYMPMSAAMVGICMPSFLLGPILVLVFGLWFDVLPVSGWGNSPGDKILPSLTLGFTYAA